MGAQGVSESDQIMKDTGINLAPCATKYVIYEINTLTAIIMRLAIKQHENRSSEYRVMPDTNDVLAQELTDNIVRGQKTNKHRKRILAELRRSAPLVEN